MLKFKQTFPKTKKIKYIILCKYFHREQRNLKLLPKLLLYKFILKFAHTKGFLLAILSKVDIKVSTQGFYSHAAFIFPVNFFGLDTFFS